MLNSITSIANLVLACIPALAIGVAAALDVAHVA